MCAPKQLHLLSQVCIAFVVFLQLAVGMVVPIARSARQESGAAVLFAAEHSMPRRNRYLRLHRLLHRATSWDDPLAWQVAAATAGVVLMAACARLAFS
jgi:hypothetical protein